MSADTQTKCRYKSPKGRLGRVLRRRFELMSIVRPLALVPAHTRVLHNKHCAKDALAKAPTKVQWLFLGRSANCARPGTPPENSVPVCRGVHFCPRPAHPRPGAGTYEYQRAKSNNCSGARWPAKPMSPTASQLFWPPVPGEICRQPAEGRRHSETAPQWRRR